MDTVEPDKADARAAHAAWHRRRIAELGSEEGWLTLVGLEWLDDGEYRVGSNSECIPRLPGGGFWGVLRVAGQSAQPAAEWTPAGGQAMALDTDRDGHPTVVRRERLSFFLIERDGRLAMRVRDADAPARREFAGIPHFPFAPAWRIAGRWDGQVALLSDLNSTNGTTVNNAPVQEWQLADGDVIRLGHSEIIVRVH